MKPEELKPGTRLVIREPLSGREFRCSFERRTQELDGTGEALNHLWCDEWVGQLGPDDRGIHPYTDSELLRRGRLVAGAVTSQEYATFDHLRAASDRRHAEQMQRLIDRSKAALNGAGLETEAKTVVSPLQAMLALALVERWDAMRWLDEVSAFACASAYEGRPESFDDAIRQAWQAAGQTFGTASLLAGLVTAYSGAVKGGEA